MSRKELHAVITAIFILALCIFPAAQTALAAEDETNGDEVRTETTETMEPEKAEEPTEVMEPEKMTEPTETRERESTQKMERDLTRLRERLGKDAGLTEEDLDNMDSELREYAEKQRDQEQMRIMVKDAVRRGCTGDCLRSAVDSMNSAMDEGMTSVEARNSVSKAIREETRKRKRTDTDDKALGERVHERVDKEAKEKKMKREKEEKKKKDKKEKKEKREKTEKKKDRGSKDKDWDRDNDRDRDSMEKGSKGGGKGR